MLVVQRRVKRRLRIKVGDTIIWVTLTEIKSPHVVRLGIEAPPEVSVLREELVERFDQ